MIEKLNGQIKVKLPYGNKEVTALVPERNFLGYYRVEKCCPLKDPTDRIKVVLEDNGVVILVSPLIEGIGENSEFVKLLKYRSSEILEMIRDNKIQDLLSGAAAYAEAIIKDRADIVLVTDGIDDEITNQMGFRRFTDLQSAIDYALGKNPNRNMVFLREGPEILPIRSD